MLSSEELKKLSKVNTFRSVYDITICWILIVGSLYLCHLNYLFIPLALVVIASRGHALGIMMHDGAHYLISKNKILNDIISNLFCSFPLQLSTDIYRKSHNDHHRYTQTKRDPNYVIMQNEKAWNFPKLRSEVRNILIKDLLLLNIPEHLIILKEWQVLPNFFKTTKLERVLFSIFVGCILSIIYINNFWIQFGIFQLGTLLINPIARLRTMSEHIHRHANGQDKVSKLEETTTINANWIEKFIFAPLNTNRHLEHHLYPTIPCFNLEKVHNIIRETEIYKTHCKYELDGYLFGKRTSMKDVLSVNEFNRKISKVA